MEQMNKRLALLQVLSFLVFLFATSCEDLSVEPTEEDEKEKSVKYVIPSGKHESKQSSYKVMEIQKLKFKVKFDSSAMYTTISPGNQADINKLYGVADCETLHQSNSARFGWRWYNNKLEIHGYTYKGGTRHSIFIDSVPLNEFHEYEIIFNDEEYQFRLDSKTATLPRSCKGVAKGYQLYPYFGGDETAPHAVTIWIEELID
jgi:hypothetical protein